MSMSIQDRVTLDALDFTLDCQTSGTVHGADLAVVCRACGDVTYLCMTHHFTVLDYLRRTFTVIPGATVSCAVCAHEAASHTAVFRVVGGI